MECIPQVGCALDWIQHTNRPRSPWADSWCISTRFSAGGKEDLLSWRILPKPKHWHTGQRMNKSVSTVWILWRHTSTLVSRLLFLERNINRFLWRTPQRTRLIVDPSITHEASTMWDCQSAVLALTGSIWTRRATPSLLTEITIYSRQESMYK